MAIKQKNDEQKSRLLEVLSTDYKWENLLLGLLATIAAALAFVIILNKGPLYIDPSFPVLGERKNALIFAWVLFGIAVFGLALVVYPFFLPAIPELKQITWPTRKMFWDHAARTFIFLIIVTGFIFVFDIAAERLLKLLGM